MDFEQAIETQRLRLLRLVAGLIVLLGFLSVGPVARGFSVSVCRFVGSVLSRAEAAARYLVMAQAHSMVAQSGFHVRQSQLSACFERVFAADESDLSVAECQRRMRVLRAVLKDLPRSARSLLRQIAKHARRTGRVLPVSPRPEARLPAPLCAWRLAQARIERPPG